MPQGYGNLYFMGLGFTDFENLQHALDDNGKNPINSESEWIQANIVTVSDELAEDVSKLIDRLEQDKDVQKVFHNMA
jgi:transcriptional/translational regulatory protein YebC/TACO1